MCLPLAFQGEVESKGVLQCLSCALQIEEPIWASSWCWLKSSLSERQLFSWLSAQCPLSVNNACLQGAMMAWCWILTQSAPRSVNGELLSHWQRVWRVCQTSQLIQYPTSLANNGFPKLNYSIVLSPTCSVRYRWYSAPITIMYSPSEIYIKWPMTQLNNTWSTYIGL